MTSEALTTLSQLSEEFEQDRHTMTPEALRQWDMLLRDAIDDPDLRGAFRLAATLMRAVLHDWLATHRPGAHVMDENGELRGLGG